MTFLLSFFDIIATLVTAYLKILAPLLAIYLILYQLASLFYSQLPSILSYYSTGKWRYLKGYDRNSVRKLLVISALMGILFSLLMYVLPREYLQNDLMFYRYTLLSVLILVAMFIFYRVGNSYHPNKLFPLIRKFYDKRLMLDELYEEKVNADLTEKEDKLSSHSPLRLVRSKFTLEELRSIVGRSDYFKVDDTSVKRLLYLVDNGVLFDDKDKIIINVGAYKDGKVKKSEIMKFLNEIFEFEYFRTIPAFSPMEDVVKPSPFVDFLNFTFEIKKLDGKVQTIHVNDLNRWIESAVRVERT